ncbi:helix-turn-helix domain-containing protein [Streptomyces sp. NPDC058676]|uniref:helix-turn-helix domain-containing protein n=1 Tax=unclassified Streptomyces TaxID=2593676 RepID=UPI003665A7DB
MNGGALALPFRFASGSVEVRQWATLPPSKGSGNTDHEVGPKAADSDVEPSDPERLVAIGGQGVHGLGNGVLVDVGESDRSAHLRGGASGCWPSPAPVTRAFARDGTAWPRSVARATDRGRCDDHHYGGDRRSLSRRRRRQPLGLMRGIAATCEAVRVQREPSLDQLGAFLKARRAQLSPGGVGLPHTGEPRRVPGLRREEVARLAAISTDYYIRLEQGRVQASAAVLDALAQVLRLDGDEREYILTLAGKSSLPPANKSAGQEVDPQMQYLLDDLTLTAGFVIGRNTDLLAWNAMAAALVMDFGRVPREQRNYVRLLFTDPAIRVLYRDWEHMARLAVSHLRMDSRRNPHDPRLTALVEELSALDPQFRLWWTSHDVAVRAGGTRLLRHPVVGDLSFQRSTFTCAEDPEQHLVVWTAEPGSQTCRALRSLAAGIAMAQGGLDGAA